MKIQALRNGKYSIEVTHNKRSGIYSVTCFIRNRTFVRYAIISLPNWPSSYNILERTKQYNNRSKRPFELGQEIDGSCVAPVIYLFHQFCMHFNWNTVIIYNKVSDIPLTKFELEKCLEFAKWQGVREHSNWDKESIAKLLLHISDIRLGRLRNFLATKLETV